MGPKIHPKLLRNVPVAVFLLGFTALVVGCGESDSLSKEERAYIRRKMLEEKYGGTVTQTQTQTVSVGTTVTLSTTVNATQ